MARSPGITDRLPEMAHAIEQIDELTTLDRLDEQSIRQMQTANLVFHMTVLEACGNGFVGFTC